MNATTTTTTTTTTTATAYDVALKRVEPIHVVAMRVTVPAVEESGDVFDRVYGVLEGYVERNGRVTGPHLAIYHDTGSGTDGRDMDVELAISFDGTPIEDDQVRVYDLPAISMAACAIHKGRFEEIDSAYNAVLTWVKDSGYRVVGPMRDVYLNCGEGDSPDYVTEVQFPIAK